MDVRDNRFLEDFTPGGRERIVSRLVYQELVAGENLFRENDPANGVCLVLEGEIDILKSAEGREQILATVHAGDYFGEVSALDGRGRSTDARARSTSSIAVIPTGDLLEVLLTEPVTLTLQLFQNVLDLVRHTNDLYINEVVHKEKMSLIGEMAGSLMHDLRNPVQIILSSLDLITLTHADDPATVDCCGKIETQCDRLINMADELLEFSRAEMKLHLERTDTNSLLLQFQAFNGKTLENYNAGVEIESEPAEIEVDPMRIQRVLQNLVFNAAQALGGKLGGRIDVRAWVADSILFLSIRDNGPGIPEQIKDRLFEPFVTYGKTGGTGLGLSIAQNIVEAHRGKITVETQPGQGTEFLVRVPQDSASKLVI